ncbi:hypothetical protein B0H16DRAFT_1476912 [Mycena metata]|uniref:Ribonuclease H1 N-terminal domain-containing protein n=1 Tax=Mycena metata TaxID=1033252 RepID=A0AAD7HAA3_9AGAR|nr:hypothetical protein B0H16DRAFT_1476912 [Mycena metata]
MSNDLTPAEIAAIMSPTHHPQCLSTEELEHLTAHLSPDDLHEVVRLLGLETLARQLPPVIFRLLVIAQRLARDQPPQYDDDVERLTHDFDAAQLFSDAIPQLSRAPPTPSRVLSTPPRAAFATSPPPVTLPRAAFATSPPPVTLPRAVFATSPLPATPGPSTRRSRSYIVDSPTKSGRVVGWFEAGSLTQGISGASVHSVHRSRKNKPRASAWTVFYGGEVGVFTDWAATQRSITGHGLAIYSGYRSKAAAEAALQYARGRGWTADSISTLPAALSSSPATALEDNALNAGSISDLWYAVCCGIVPGVYRSYLECTLNTSGVRGNLEEAEAAFAQAQADGHVKRLFWSEPQLKKDDELQTAKDRIKTTLPPSKCTPEEILDRRAQAAWEYRRRHREAINEKARIRMHKRRAELKQAPSAVQEEHAAKARQYRRRYIERNAPVARSVVSPKKKKMVSAEIVRVKPKSTETHPLTAAITRTPPTQLMMSSEYRLASPPQRRAGSSPIPPSPPTPTPIRKTAAPPGPKRVLPTPVAPKGPWWESLYTIPRGINPVRYRKATPPRDARQG